MKINTVGLHYQILSKEKEKTNFGSDIFERKLGEKAENNESSASDSHSSSDMARQNVYAHLSKAHLRLLKLQHELEMEQQQQVQSKEKTTEELFG